MWMYSKKILRMLILATYYVYMAIEIDVLYSAYNYQN